MLFTKTELCCFTVTEYAISLLLSTGMLFMLPIDISLFSGVPLKKMHLIIMDNQLTPIIDLIIDCKIIADSQPLISAVAGMVRPC